MSNYMRQEDIEGFGLLARSERLFWIVFCEVRDQGRTKHPEAEIDLLRRGHLEDYDGVLKITESGFQLMDFLKLKMSGERPPIVREA